MLIKEKTFVVFFQLGAEFKIIFDYFFRLRVHVASPGLPLLVEPHLHFLQNFGGITNDEFHGTAGLKKNLI